jgi:hypothetical protein
MAKNSKVVLVLEKSSHNLGVTKDGNEVVLEGVFAQFGVVNNNDRLYEESEYLPHLEYLNKKIGDKRLLGELDHPKESFDISLSKVSHLVEKLEYDKAKRQIVGRVRLLDTPSGKIAKELVEAGVPISVSSRAAGVVESNKKVKIKRIFTYDLVADPGFENAVLTKMNESLGILNENVSIYDVTSKYPELLEEETVEINTENNIKTNQSDMEYVTSEEMNTYSLILKEEIEGIYKKLSALSENNEISGKVKEMSESVVRMQEYIDYLAGKVDNSIQYGEYVAEKLDKVIDYTDYVAKTLDESIQYSNYVAEKTDKSIEYSEYLKEQIEKGIQYSEYLKECIEKGVSYTEYVAEQLDKGIEYTEYVAESANKGIAYTEYIAEQLNDTISYADYLGESLNKGIAYTEYVGEQTQQLADYTEYMLNENKATATPDNGTVVNENKSTDYSSLTDKVDSLLESIKKQKMDDAVIALNEASKRNVSQALDESKNPALTRLTSSLQTGDALISNMMNESQAQELNEKWLTEAPEEYRALWESLEPQVKNNITAQSKFYKLDTGYQIKNFWETRKLSKSQPVNESNNHETPTALGYTPSYLEAIKANLDRFGKKF